MFTLVCHPLEMANKINDADHILITLRFSSLFKSNARELTITLGFQSTIERADSPVREITCSCNLKIKKNWSSKHDFSEMLCAKTHKHEYQKYMRKAIISKKHNCKSLTHFSKSSLNTPSYNLIHFEISCWVV